MKWQVREGRLGVVTAHGRVAHVLVAGGFGCLIRLVDKQVVEAKVGDDEVGL